MRRWGEVVICKFHTIIPHNEINISKFNIFIAECVYADFICGKMLCQFERQPSISSPSSSGAKVWGGGGFGMRWRIIRIAVNCALPELVCNRVLVVPRNNLDNFTCSQRPQTRLQIPTHSAICPFGGAVFLGWMMNERIYQRPLVVPRVVHYQAGWRGDTSQLIYWG